eukprot:UN33731
MILCPLTYTYNYLTVEPKTFRSILITGASGGIGKGLANFYANNGIELYLFGRSVEKLNKVKVECQAKGAIVHTYPSDVTDKEQMGKIDFRCRFKKL